MDTIPPMDTIPLQVTTDQAEESYTVYDLLTAHNRIFRNVDRPLYYINTLKPVV